MAEYPDFKHGTRAEIAASVYSGTRISGSNQAIVYIGTAPVGQVEGGANKVNKPIVCRNMAEARTQLGYSDNWAKYTLCEAMHAHFELNGVGPVVFINVLDPATHVVSGKTTVSITPVGGRARIENADDISLDSVVVKKGNDTLVKDTDYTIKFNHNRGCIDINEKTSGALGTAALSISYNVLDPAAVTTTNVIGATNGYGLNTGIYAIKNVYNLTGYIPAYIVAPGFSSIPAVHDVLAAESLNISKHWNAWLFTDMPILDQSGTAITLQNAPTWKVTNGYNKDNESVFFPMAVGTDGKHYHLSVLNAANFQQLLIENDGIPYMTGSNTDCTIIENLYFGEEQSAYVYDDELINRALNANGINSAAYVGGRWAIWGMFAGSYNQDDATYTNMFDTCVMMLYYLTNDFQHRRNRDVDKPMSMSNLRSIVSEEQSRVDGLLGIGALTYGKVELDASRVDASDVFRDDYNIIFNITTTPLVKSLKATANWTNEGFEIYFAAMDA